MNQAAAGGAPRVAFARLMVWDRIRDVPLSLAARVCVISALLITPCFWQIHVQAGGLSSRLYNAWLALLIEQGNAPGLAITSQWHKILFDLTLAALMRTVGPWAAEHIAVPLVLMIFVWGAFALVCAVTGRRPWYILTFLVMLGYGWVFHSGFMNFYLSTGLCCWALALLWVQKWKTILGALPLLVLASFAHAIPVMWAVALAVYMFIARRIGPVHRAILTFAGVSGLLVLRHFLLSHFPARWLATQALQATGADQLGLFGTKYYPLIFMLLAIWLSLMLQVLDKYGEEHFVLGVPFQLWMLTSAAVLFIPSAIQLPDYKYPLTFITGRLSLFAAVLVCVLLGKATPRNPEKAGIAILMGLFFSFVYVDTRALNHLEDLMGAKVAELPAGSRVTSAVCDLRSGYNQIGHLIDRVCIGRCFSYANHEPATAGFRIRALPGNGIAASDYQDAEALQEGTYVVKKADEPLYQIYLRGAYLDARMLKAGDVTGTTCFESTPSFSNVLRTRK